MTQAENVPKSGISLHELRMESVPVYQKLTDLINTARQTRTGRPELDEPARMGLSGTEIAIQEGIKIAYIHCTSHNSTHTYLREAAAATSILPKVPSLEDGFAAVELFRQTIDDLKPLGQEQIEKIFLKLKNSDDLVPIENRQII